MPKTPAPREGTDFFTYQANDGDRHSGWNWYCMHCCDDTGRGWRWNRVDARRDARKHAGECASRTTAPAAQQECTCPFGPEDAHFPDCPMYVAPVVDRRTPSEREIDRRTTEQLRVS